MDGNFNVYDRAVFLEINNLSLSGNSTNLNLSGIYEKNKIYQLCN